MANSSLIVVDGDIAQVKPARSIADSLQAPFYHFATGEELLASGVESSGGVLVCEFRLMGINGLDLQQRLIALNSPIQIVFHTAHAETWLTVLAIQNGAFTVLDKPVAESDLAEVIHRAWHRYHEQRQRSEDVRRLSEKLGELSPRQIAVLKQMTAGVPNKDIAMGIGVSVRTVEAYRHVIYQKTGTASLADLIRLVLQSEIDLDRFAPTS